MPRRLQSVLKATENPPEHAPDLRKAVKTAIHAMDWLAESDQGLVSLALHQADVIETARERAEELEAIARDNPGNRNVYQRLDKLAAQCDAAKAVGWLGPQLQGVLRDLGGTPAARRALRPDQPVGGRLAEIRRAAGKHDS